MDHKAKRVLAVTLAAFTATSPCLTSAAEVDPTAILAEKNLLKVNVRTKGGAVTINEGEEDEQTVKITTYGDTDFVDVYKNDVLIESINAEDNQYTYVCQADASSLVTLDAEAEEGYELILAEDKDEESIGFKDPVETFSYPVFMDADKTVSFEFAEKTDEKAAEDAAQKAEEAAKEAAAQKAKEEAEEAAKKAEDAAKEAAQKSEDAREDTTVEDASQENTAVEDASQEDILINPNENGTSEVTGEAGTVEGETEETLLIDPTAPETDSEEPAESGSDANAENEDNAGEESATDMEDEIFINPNAPEETAGEAAEEAGDETVEETAEHFTEVDENISSLDASLFASSRLVVLSNSGIIDPEHQIAQYDDIYLLQYTSPEQAMTAYLYYEGMAEAVEPDIALDAAADTMGENGAEVEVSEEVNPLDLLSEEPDSVEAQTADRVIALIDTGASECANVIDRVSLIDDILGDTNGHGDLMVQSILSMNPNAKILSIRAMGDDGKGTVSSVVAALEYAIEQNVSIINLSMYAKASLLNSVLVKEINKAIDAGIIVVGAAGNDGADAAGYVPGSVDTAYIIGAANADGTRTTNSNYGSTVDYNIVADTTSEAAAKFSGYVSLYGVDQISSDIIVPSGCICESDSENAYAHLWGCTVFQKQLDADCDCGKDAGTYILNHDPNCTAVRKAYATICTCGAGDKEYRDHDYSCEVLRQIKQVLCYCMEESADPSLHDDVCIYKAYYEAGYLSGLSIDIETDVDDPALLSSELSVAAEDDVDFKKFTLNIGTEFRVPQSLAQADISTFATTYKTVTYYNKQGKEMGRRVAYCLQPTKVTPNDGHTYTGNNISVLDNNNNQKNMSKAMWYLYGGPMWGKTVDYADGEHKVNLKTLITNAGCTTNGQYYALCHYILAYFYDSSNWNKTMSGATALNTKGQNLVKNCADHIRHLPRPYSYIDRLDASGNVTASLSSNGRYASEPMRYVAPDENIATITLPAGTYLVYNNADTGGNVTKGSSTSATTVKLEGNSTFRIEVDAAKVTAGTKKYTFKTLYAINYEAYLLKLANYQDIGFSYYTGDKTLSFGVTFPNPPAQKGGLSVRKASANETVTKNNSNYSLAGAVYKVYSDKACTKAVLTLPKTDSSGYAASADNALNAGTYYVKEYSPSPGYNTDNTVYTVTVKAGSKASANTASSKEPPKTGNLKITKASALPDMTNGNSCYSLEGAEFTIYKDSSFKTVYKKVTTNKDGVAVCNSMPLGDYWVKETKAPKGFELNSSWNSGKITITANHTTAKPYETKCTDNPGNDPLGIQITKIWDGAETATIPTLKGTQFTVKYFDNMNKNTSGTPKRTWVIEVKEVGGLYVALLSKDYLVKELSDSLYHDANGKPILPYGTYSIQETKPAEGYTLEGELKDENGNVICSTTEPYVTVVEKNSDAVSLYGGNEYTGYNKPVDTSIKIVKKDNNGKPLAGVEFQLTDPDGKVVGTEMTGSDGVATFSGLYPNRYTVTEIKTAAGYSLLKEPFTIETPTRLTEEEVIQHNVDRAKVTYDPAEDIYYVFDLTYEVTDSPNFQLPTTGSGGFWKYGIIGMGIMGAVAAGLFANEYQKRNKKIKKI